jgi:hypothetical protein
VAECITQPDSAYTATHLSGLSGCREPIQSGWAKNHPVMLSGNAILLNGVSQTANREIGDPGLPVAKLTCPAYAMIRLEI